jgi:hypothetical protein
MKTSIIEKIQKVLELAKRGGTEEEADTALQLAHQLLAKYNLTLDEVESHTTEEDYFIDDSVKSPIKLSWQHYVYQAISNLYFCHYIKGRSSHNIIGKPSNVEVVKYLAAYIVQTGEKLAKQECATTRERNDFKKGFCLKISERAEAEVARAKRGDIKDEQGNALILRPLYEKTANDIKIFLAEKGPRTHKTSFRAAGSTSGFNLGQQAGEHVSLRGTGITANGQRQHSIE